MSLLSTIRPRGNVTIPDNCAFQPPSAATGVLAAIAGSSSTNLSFAGLGLTSCIVPPMFWPGNSSWSFSAAGNALGYSQIAGLFAALNSMVSNQSNAYYGTIDVSGGTNSAPSISHIDGSFSVAMTGVPTGVIALRSASQSFAAAFAPGSSPVPAGQMLMVNGSLARVGTIHLISGSQDWVWDQVQGGFMYGGYKFQIAVSGSVNNDTTFNGTSAFQTGTFVFNADHTGSFITGGSTYPITWADDQTLPTIDTSSEDTATILGLLATALGTTFGTVEVAGDTLSVAVTDDAQLPLRAPVLGDAMNFTVNRTAGQAAATSADYSNLLAGGTTIITN